MGAAFVEQIDDAMADRAGGIEPHGGQVLDARGHAVAHLGRERLGGNFERTQRFDVRVIYRAGKADAQQLGQPDQRDQGRAAIAPEFGEVGAAAVHLVENATRWDDRRGGGWLERERRWGGALRSFDRLRRGILV